MRKGAISTSTNTLVVLIVSVIVLTLILGLVTGWFSELGGSFEIDAPEPAPVSSQTPITLSPQEVRTEPAETTGLRIRVLNTNEQELELAADITCSQEGLYENIQVIPQTLQPRESIEQRILFDIPNTAPVGAYLCQVTYEEIGSTQFQLNII